MTLAQRCFLVATVGLIFAGVFLAVVSPPPEKTNRPRASYGMELDGMTVSAGGLGHAALRSRALQLETAETLAATFAGMGYDLDSVRSGDLHVPRLFLASLPGDIASISETDERKDLFVRAVLPLILQANEEIIADRQRLWRIRYRVRVGEPIHAIDRLWLRIVAEEYGLEANNLEGLARRMDIVPVSLALAQAAEETGWGTSRFVREGNALYGEWRFDGSEFDDDEEEAGMVPRKRPDGEAYTVRTFDSLLDSMRAYTRNLNTHYAYQGFRAKRAEMRRRGKALNGAVLANTLTRYSARGTAYVRSLKVIIRSNGFSRFDDVRLQYARPADVTDPAA